MMHPLLHIGLQWEKAAGLAYSGSQFLNLDRKTEACIDGDLCAR